MIRALLKVPMPPISRHFLIASFCSTKSKKTDSKTAKEQHSPKEDSKESTEQPVDSAKGPETAVPNPKQKNLFEYTTNELLKMDEASVDKKAYDEVLAKKIKEVEQEISSIKTNTEAAKGRIDDYARLMTEMDDKIKIINENIESQNENAERAKKTAEKELDEIKVYGVTKLAKEVLEVADCLARCKKLALENYPNSKDPFIEGIIKIDAQLQQVLNKFEIKEFDPIGSEYNPHNQESLAKIPCPPGSKPNVVGYTMRTGYMIKGRVLRNAQVGIFA